jgi:hypothetical protein
VTVTVIGTAGPLQVGYVPGKVWVCGAFLTPDEARDHARYTEQAAGLADGGEGAEDMGTEQGKFL